MKELNLGEENGKHIISLRTLPKLKYELSDEASKRGLTLSEYCESILANRNLILLESTSKKQIQREKLELEKLVEELQTKAELPPIYNILSDVRLLSLFENLRGKDDVIENAYGENFKITYTTPVELLKAIIYSIKIKL